MKKGYPPDKYVRSINDIDPSFFIGLFEEERNERYVIGCLKRSREKLPPGSDESIKEISKILDSFTYSKDLDIVKLWGGFISSGILHDIVVLYNSIFDWSQMLELLIKLGPEEPVNEELQQLIDGYLKEIEDSENDSNANNPE